MKDNKNNDEFWDLSMLVPPRKQKSSGTVRDTTSVEIDIEPPETTRTIGDLAVRFREVKREPRPKKYDDTVTMNLNISSTDERSAARTGSGRANVETVSAAADRLKIRALDIVRSVSDDIKGEAREKKSDFICEYEPQDSLIHKVRIMRWSSSYSFYEQFRYDAKRYMNVSGEECTEVEFFSYTPQYRQMSPQQMRYYFYWRSCARRGEWLHADFSYVLLYIYEIINLYDQMNPSDGLRLLCGIWKRYRSEYGVIDKYLSEWLADFCLINKLPCPRDELADMMLAIMENTTIREFYLPDISDDDMHAEALYTISSNYSWQKSKFADTDERAELYAEHIRRCLSYVTKKSSDKRLSFDGMRTVKTSRDAFCGSLCAHNIKRRIDIEYLSYTRSHEQRMLVTDIVKYAENKLRAHLGIKARLRVDALDENIKSLADEYFASVFPNERRRETKAEAAAAEEKYYDAVYGALTTGIDREAARDIEVKSWNVTELLTSDETASVMPETDDVSPEDDAPYESTDESSDETQADGGLDPVMRSFLKAIAEHDGDAADEICRKAGIYSETLVSDINDYAVDVIGDIVIEEDDDGYVPVEDYMDEIYTMINGGGVTE